MADDTEMEVSQATKSEYERMEVWLDEHPDFVQDYFSRKANRSMVDGWVLAHALTQNASNPGSSLGYHNYPADTASTGSGGSRPSSGANTPVRKISAQEFERGGQVLKPMVSTVDGMPTFLGAAADPAPVKSARKTHSELKALDERELMYELVIDICNDLDVTSLCYKILQNVSYLLNADRCSLFLAQGERDTDKCCLVSKLFDVNMHSTIEECTGRREEIRIPWGTGINGYVAKTGQPVNIPDAYEVSYSAECICQC